MNITNKVLVTTLGVLALVFGAYVAVSLNLPQKVLASVTQNSEYQATSTRSTAGANNLANLTVLSDYTGCTATCPGTLGSVVITGANTGIVRFWNATTSDITQRVGATSTLTFVEVPASLAAGTYTFDVNFNNGILYEFVGGTSAPTSTVTWRNR